MEKGYVKLWRAIRNSTLWHTAEGRPATRLEAWIDMILEASWETRTVTLGKQTVELRRGELAGTVRALATRWRWSRSATERHLSRLVDEGMIERIGPQKSGLWRIVNYARYQGDLGHDLGHNLGHLSPTNETTCDNGRDKIRDKIWDTSIVNKELRKKEEEEKARAHADDAAPRDPAAAACFWPEFQEIVDTFREVATWPYERTDKLERHLLPMAREIGIEETVRAIRTHGRPGCEPWVVVDAWRAEIYESAGGEKRETAEQRAARIMEESHQ